MITNSCIGMDAINHYFFRRENTFYGCIQDDGKEYIPFEILVGQIATTIA